MRVAMVTGSRKWEDRATVYAALDAFNPDLVIHGGAAGADALAHAWCKKRGRAAYVHFPDYERVPKGAPLKRNLEMVLAMVRFRRDGCATKVLGFPFPDSNGTRHALSSAERVRLDIEVHEGG